LLGSFSEEDSTGEDGTGICSAAAGGQTQEQGSAQNSNAVLGNQNKFSPWARAVQDHRDEYIAIRNSVLVSSKDIGTRVSAEVDEATLAAKRAPSVSVGSVVVGAAAIGARARPARPNDAARRGSNPSPSPLSEDTAGAIFQYLVKSDYARQIWKDVTRTQQTIAWFVEAETQKLMHRILLVWSLAHQDIGYKQGMNELLAVLLYLICTERGGLGGEGHAELRQEIGAARAARATPAGQNGGDDDDAVNGASIGGRRGMLNKADGGKVTTITRKGAMEKEVHPFEGQERIHDVLDVMLDPAYCEHDAYMLFSLIMVRMEGVFCPVDDAPPPVVSTEAPTSAVSATMAMATATTAGQRKGPLLRRRARSSAASLLQRFSRVQAEIVHLQNPDLAEHMIMQGVEPHMYLLRWMRLLCSREFAMPGLWFVWDAIIAINPETFEFNDFICAALVLSLSDPIMQQEDAQGILQELQHFNQGFNIDIMRLLDLARTIKTRLTGRLLDPVNLDEL
jgi:hypothetical protein